MDWDVFISHASEDKDSFALPLAEALQTKGLKVWFDKFSLIVGDSLRRSIDYGLANSRYGIVILSPNFFAKEWPQKELDGLVSQEISGRKVILPIWHNITADQIRKYSPILADRVAVTSSYGLEYVVAELQRAMGSTSERLIPKTTITSPLLRWLNPLKRLKWWEVVSFIVAVTSCIAAWLALPQIQNLLVERVTSSPTSTSIPTHTLPTPTLIPIPTYTVTTTPVVTATPTSTPDIGATVTAAPTITPLDTTPPTSTNTPLPPTNILIPPTPTSAVVGRIAFQSNRDGNSEIYTMNIDGSKQTRLTNNNPNEDTEPTWSPDGKRIAFVRRDAPSVWPPKIYIMNDDGSEATFLTGEAWTPAWSPDMTRLAITGGRNWPKYIYIITTDGGATRLTPGSYPSWSPDGQRLVFGAFDTNSKCDIFVINSNGGGLTQLTNTPFNETYPAWSPDGKYIAFVSDGDGNNEIYVMHSDGSNATRLTTNSWGDTTPAWSPDSTQIAFASNRDGNWEIYVMNADGKEPRNLTNHPAYDAKPAWSPK